MKDPVVSSIAHHSPLYRMTSSSIRRLCVWPLILLALFIQSAQAAFVDFSNCLNPSIIQSKNPQQLQFQPFFVDATFNTTDTRHNLNITIYGNVTGQAFTGDYPPPDSQRWLNVTDDFGKIVNSTVNYTTLFTTFNFLTYTPYDAQPGQFCDFVLNKDCPLGPLFYKNASDFRQLHAFGVSHDLQSSFAFATLASKFKIQSGNQGAAAIACITANITPDLGASLSGALTWIPLTILILVGIATILAAKLSPASSLDFFYWTSNFGRDPNTLRMVTPGFGDCLQYIQFIVLAGSLSLNYPGFYQPAVSKAGWSTLTFNESFVSHGNGTQSLVDGIYRTNGTYGLTRLSQLVGMTSDIDIWAGMAVWLCVMISSVVILCQLGFAINWFVRQLRETTEEDLRSKNFSFTAGNVTRIVFNFFLLPIVSLSLFQLVIASRSPATVVALSVLLLTGSMLFAAWIFRLIFTTKPRVHLFDQLQLLLLYGPLYNTYSDEAAPFAFIPVLLNFMRGIAIGAIQPSGIAQLVILAICEVILILTLHAFRPFQALTSMNAYHTSFSVVRLITTLLSVAFVPSLDVSEAIRGWIGYAILLLHAMVLVFGFFLNALQTMIEVLARMSGAGEARGGLTRIFGMRQLSKRAGLRGGHGSLTSDAAMLDEHKSIHLSHRLTSMSGSSAGMLHPNDRGSGHFDHFSQGENTSTRSGNSPGPSTPGGSQSPFQFLPTAGGGLTSHNRRPSAGGAPYYRPPRQRRPTLEALGTRSRSLQSDESVEDHITSSPPRAEGAEQRAFSPHRNSIISPSSFREFRDETETDLKRKQTDYYVSRESDFYYGVRGPALSSTPSRRRKTGPADPMSPVGSATGWFKNFLGGKRKEKGKGFEVVRSTPLHLLPTEEEEEDSPPLVQEPYRDSPPQAVSGAASADMSMSANLPGKPSRALDFNGDQKMQRASDDPPLLRDIPTAGNFGVRSQAGSKDVIDFPADAAVLPPNRGRARTSSNERNLINVGSPARHAGPASRHESFRRPGHFPSASDDEHDRRVPFSSNPTAETGEQSAGNSMTSSIYPPDVLPMENSQYPAPYMTGQVGRHLASSSIHVYEGPGHLGSTAELVDPTEARKDTY